MSRTPTPSPPTKMPGIVCAKHGKHDKTEAAQPIYPFDEMYEEDASFFGEFSRATTASGADSQTTSCDVMDVGNRDDAFEATLRSVKFDAARLLQLRVSVPSISDWARSQRKISNAAGHSPCPPPFVLESSGAPLDSAVWISLGHRFSVLARENFSRAYPLREGNN